MIEMNGKRFGFKIAAALIMLVYIGCGRKDVTRSGEIKLRGERPVSIENRNSGDLLQKGIASWYGHPYHGRLTANGEKYNMWEMTAAHKTLPFGTVVRVVNKDNGREARVRINDRGPFVKGRIIDLSRKAAQELGVEGPGTARVALYLLSSDQERQARSERVRSQRTSLLGGYWTIQVGSYSQRSRADAMAKRMREYSRDVAVRREEGLFKVRVGKFELKVEAGKLAEYLTENNIDIWIVHIRK